jgi:hypothetical protein
MDQNLGCLYALWLGGRWLFTYLILSYIIVLSIAFPLFSWVDCESLPKHPPSFYGPYARLEHWTSPIWGECYHLFNCNKRQ